MLAIQILLFGVVLGLIPIIIGKLFVDTAKGIERWLFAWVSGQIVLWAVFLVLSVPLILLEKSFTLLCTCFNIATALLLIASAGILLVKHKKEKCTERSIVEKEQPGNALCYVLWAVFGALLLLQLILTVFLAYEEGDDAFYIAVSTITESSNTMYKTLPYIGMATGLDARHGLAPFPIWVAYLARITGMPAVTVGQIVLPLVLIVMAYGIYYLMGKRLFHTKKEQVALFMVLVAVLILFGGYSVYSAENFLLVRASQGKAVIANIVIPFMFYLLFLLLEKMQKQETQTQKQWIVLVFTMMTGCLCSTMGTVLTCILLAVVGCCMAVAYRKWKVLLPIALCCAIPMGMALLYYTLK